MRSDAAPASPEATTTVLADLLAVGAQETPDAVLLRTDTGDLTYAQVRDGAARLAAGFAGLGVGAGDRVVSLLHNSADAVLTWFSLAWLGAVYVPVNTALQGRGLAHTLSVAGARVVVVDHDLLPVLAEVLGEASTRGTTRGAVRGTVVVRGGLAAGAAVADARLLPFEGLALASGPGAARIEGVDDLAPALMLFTSGTTGVSKACVLSNRYVVRQAQLHAENFRLTAHDVLYSPFPLFHIDAATLTLVAALSVGGTAAIARRFSVSGFWDDVRRYGATVFNFMGATLTLLWKQPASDDDRRHVVRLAWGVPMPDWRTGWEERFGVPIYEVYGLTDAGIPVYDPLDAPPRPGSCGRVIPQFEVAVADAAGVLVGAGLLGEILVRGREPGLVMTEYYGMPEATAEAFRDGWFHTGDLGSLDADGYLTFAGRAKDAIRRRGENISAYEVEQVVESHPAVLQAAAIGVPSELMEEDVKVCVVLRPGQALHADALAEHCRRNGAQHAVPRYIEFVAELPRTPTQKVEKFRLREAGVTPTTWDGEAPR